jgi:hypothetical protein
MSIHDITFCVSYQGNPSLLGTYETPASAMARGIGVVRSSDTIAKASVGIEPLGFLNSEVTTDGPSFEELTFIQNDNKIIHEKKVSEGVVQLTNYEPGEFYVMSGNIKSGTTFAVDEYVYMAANGEFTDGAGASVGDEILGIVDAIDVTALNMTDAVVWKAVKLGQKTS